MSATTYQYDALRKQTQNKIFPKATNESVFGLYQSITISKVLDIYSPNINMKDARLLNL